MQLSAPPLIVHFMFGASFAEPAPCTLSVQLFPELRLVVVWPLIFECVVEPPHAIS